MSRSGQRCLLLSALVLAAVATVGSPPFGGALPLAQAHDLSRAKAGPVTIRGVATTLTSHTFRLSTASRGSYTVTLARATTISEKGASGGLRVVSGDHVGVRGFLHGRSITAIAVRIYPTKPKARTIKGTLVAARPSSLDVQTGGVTSRIYVVNTTSVRLGTSPASLRSLPIGDRIDVRVETVKGKLTAITVHALKPKATSHRTQLRGTIIAVSPGSVRMRANGGVITVRISSSTAVHFGSGQASSTALKPGEDVTVYAQQSGRQLVATSIHIHKTTSVRSVALRGRIRGLSAGSFRLATSNGTVEVSYSASTTFQIGTQAAKASDLRVGDQVSVRARAAGRTWVASRVHVFAASRALKSVTGTLTGLRGGIATVLTTSGVRYQVHVDASAQVVLGNRRGQLSQLHAGYHVRIKAKLDVAGQLHAVTVTANPPPIKLVTRRGTLIRVSHQSMVIRSSGGGQLRVVYEHSVIPLLHGKPAPPASLFSGVKVTARGTKRGNTLSATSIRITVSSRKGSGHISQLRSSGFVLLTKTGSRVTVDVPAGVPVTDVGKRIPLRALSVGTYMSVVGYEESSATLRATSLRVDHPTVNLTGLVTGLTPIRIRSAAGATDTLHLNAKTLIEAVRYHFPVSPSDIPMGVQVHVVGVVATNGEVEVSTLSVHLQSQTLRGQLTAITPTALTVAVSGTSYHLRPVPGMTLQQSSSSLSIGDLVRGDDVTAYGLSLSNSVLLTRKIQVHRRRLTIDGTITSVSVTGFSMQSADGTHQVLLTASTSSAGTAQIEPGMLAHVTGYLRGDGTILAIKVRLTKQKG